MVADGNTIVVLSSGHAIEQAFRKDAGYDLLKDFKLIASLAAMSQVLVSRSDFRFQTTQQLLAYLRTSPGKVSCATASPPQLEYLRAIAGVDLTIVPYRGANKSVQDVLGGHIDLAFPPLPEVASHLQSGTLRGLGISSLARVAAFPDIPTLAEAVPGFHLEGWYGLAVAARTPLEIVERLRHELSAITEAPDFAEFLEKRNYAPPIPLSEFPAIVANEVRRFQKLIIDQKLPQYE
jgi:tripartite-type tricarboxylate transporter receptor subunit TctC